MQGSEPGNPAGGMGRETELGSVGLEGNVPPESEWLNCFQTKTPQDGTRLALRIWGGRGIFSLGESGLSCCRRLRALMMTLFFRVH